MERPRIRTRKSPALGQPPPASERRRTPVAIQTNTGPLATAAWLLTRGLMPTERNWYVEVELFAGAAKFDIEIFAEEWGIAFHHDDRVSWIRVTDIPFVHGRDEHELLRETTSLRDVGNVIRLIENRYGLTFDREAAVIRTNITSAEPEIREWVASL